MFQGITHCWSCMCPLAGMPTVQLSETVSVPCCMACWSDVPISERLSIGHKFAETVLVNGQRIQTRETLQSIEDLFRAALSDFQKRTRQEPWEHTSGEEP